jgi:hypothetical protein
MDVISNNRQAAKNAKIPLMTPSNLNVCEQSHGDASRLHCERDAVQLHPKQGSLGYSIGPKTRWEQNKTK